MKHFYTALLFLVLFSLCLVNTSCAAEEDKRPLISTTIDFLDIAFQSRSREGYLTLEEYEEHFKRYAAAGIGCVNLRTNVIGVTFQKSAYTLQYGEKGAWHYHERAMSQRLIETLKHYDPLTETIRLGHKYGMQVWCWENVTDEGGGAPYDEKLVPDYAKADCKRTGGYPLIDPFFRTHPGCWATAKPTDFSAVAAANYRAQEFPVGKIVITACRSDRPPIRFGRDDIDLYYSYDNDKYVRYDGSIEFIAEQLSDGRNQLTLKGLNIRAPYVKIAPKKMYDMSSNYTLAIKGHHTSGKVYNTKGFEVSSFWGWAAPAAEVASPLPDGFQTFTSLNFDSMPSIAVDHCQYQVGFFVGTFVASPYLIGVVEFCDPMVMAHKLNRFSELAQYPFDGYRLTLNCHSDGDDPALRERLLDKTGKDIWRDELPRERIVQERAEGFAEYAEGCKKLIGNRPLYINGWRPGDIEFFTSLGRTNMGSIIWPYERLIKNGTIDGVIMYEDFADYFTPEVTGGRKIKLGLHRCIEIGRIRGTLDPFELVKESNALDEIEYYGAVCMSEEYLEWFRQFTGKGKSKTAKE